MNVVPANNPIIAIQIVLDAFARVIKETLLTVRGNNTQKTSSYENHLEYQKMKRMRVMNMLIGDYCQEYWKG